MAGFVRVLGRILFHIRKDVWQQEIFEDGASYQAEGASGGVPLSPLGDQLEYTAP